MELIQIGSYIGEQVEAEAWRKEIVPASVAGTPRDMEIYRAERKQKRIKHNWHGDHQTFCPPKWHDLAIGSGACGFGCRACFLMLTFRAMRDPMRPVVYANIDDYERDIRSWLVAETWKTDQAGKKRVKLSHLDTLGLGIDCADSLLFEGVTGQARMAIPLFANPATNPRGNKLVLLTKSANVHYLEGLPTANIAVTFSVNPEREADLWEGVYRCDTCSGSGRIQQEVDNGGRSTQLQRYSRYPEGVSEYGGTVYSGEAVESGNPAYATSETRIPAERSACVIGVAETSPAGACSERSCEDAAAGIERPRNCESDWDESANDKPSASESGSASPRGLAAGGRTCGSDTRTRADGNRDDARGWSRTGSESETSGLRCRTGDETERVLDAQIRNAQDVLSCATDREKESCLSVDSIYHDEPSGFCEDKSTDDGRTEQQNSVAGDSRKANPSSSRLLVHGRRKRDGRKNEQQPGCGDLQLQTRSGSKPNDRRLVSGALGHQSDFNNQQNQISGQKYRALLRERQALPRVLESDSSLYPPVNGLQNAFVTCPDCRGTGRGTRITPPMDSRLEACLRAQKMGFEVRWRLDPILTPDGWQRDYEDFFRQAAHMGLAVRYVTLGTYREKNASLDQWSAAWGLPAMEWEPDGMVKDGTHFHLADGRRIEIYGKVIEMIGRAPWATTPRVELCKEPHAMRRRVGINCVSCNCLQ